MMGYALGAAVAVLWIGWGVAWFRWKYRGARLIDVQMTLVKTAMAAAALPLAVLLLPVGAALAAVIGP